MERRTGGVGSILHTLIHIIDIENDWLQDLKGNKAGILDYNEFTSLEDAIQLHERWHSVIEEFVYQWRPEMTEQLLVPEPGKKEITYGEVMNHIIVHGIHHIGQLSA